jgi:hypothetical protein
MVQGRCESPPGQVCFGQWTPAGPGHEAGVFFGCECKGIDNGPVLPPPKRSCELMIDLTQAQPRFQCVGNCKSGQICRLGYYRNPLTGSFALDCRCRFMRPLAPN